MGFRAMLAALALLAGSALGARAASVPREIRIGTLYASTGPFAAISMPAYDGIRLWASQVNATGGVYVKPYGRKIPVRLIAYDDQSSTATAATLYNELITRDHVNILISDSGSVLTSVAVPIAEEHKMFLFDISGTGKPFFTRNNPDIVLTSLPMSTLWPSVQADFLDSVGLRAGIRRVAVLYATNDFSGTHADALVRYLKQAGKLRIVYDQGVPTNTANYTVLINNIAATHPDAVIELGFPGNDIGFLRALHESGEHFRYVFTLFGGFEMHALLNGAGAAAMDGTFTYVPAALYPYQVNYGPTLAAFHAAWDKAYPNGSGVPWGADGLMGYMTALVVQKALATTSGMGQLDLRRAVFAQSGRLRTLAGPFRLNSEGGQTGEMTPIGQLHADGHGGLRLVAVYPPATARGKPEFGK
ncbi:MAG: ABC transporter substrate-binding protein [Acetobacteraceae bacterium]